MKKKVDKPETIPNRLESVREKVQDSDTAIVFAAVEATVAHMEQKLDEFMQEMSKDDS